MKKNIASFITIFLFPVIGFCAQINSVQETPLEAFTLQDCYRLALKQSELIAIDSEKIKEAQAHFIEAFGSLLPQVSFARTDTREHSQASPSFNRNFEQKFVFTQALFSGFKEFAGIKASKFENKQRANEEIRAKQLLYVDVADAFYFLMEEREDLKTLETIRQAFLDRIKELQNRVSLGRSRDSEVVSTQTQLYTLLDQIELAKSQESIARELLEFLVGRKVKEIKDSDNKISLGPESEYLDKAATRPDVLAANFAWQIDREGVTIAKSGLLPQISLQGDYYSHRASSPTDSRWDAFLTLNVPIFEGTTIYGKIKEAKAIAKESELLFQRAGRSALRDIHDSYVNAQVDLSRVGILGMALKSAEQNYNLQLQDYKLSVVNNLDVLTAIQSLEDVRRNFIHITYESKRFYWQFLAAVGEVDLE